ncbi:hypothetical protein [Mycobacterium simiae]|uniref:hypothetical protein n=1 Tax=Mycobacterium simiae TaxID=1784 RepID=UPI0015933674|nr:hypothetical protein [Mycobacterium simiae]
MTPRASKADGSDAAAWWALNAAANRSHASSMVAGAPGRNRVLARLLSALL